MDDKNAILAAHVAYELQRYQDDTLHATIAAEIAPLWHWLAQIKVNAIVTPAAASEWIRQTAATFDLPEGALSFVRENIAVAFETLQEDGTRVEELFPRALFDRVVGTVAGMTRLRQEIAHQFVSSSVYSMLISDVLYHGIKGFVLTDNSLAKNIPGASSFVKLGQNALNAAAPQLEKNVDKQLTAFINGNIQKTILESEQFLNKSVDAEAIRKMAGEVWETNATTPMSTVAGYVDAGERDALVQVAEEFWQHFRQTALFAELVDNAVRTFFLRYGKKELHTVLTAFGITQEHVVDAIFLLIRPAVAHARESGALEEQIRARLDGFYSVYFAR